MQQTPRSWTILDIVNALQSPSPEGLAEIDSLEITGDVCTRQDIELLYRGFCASALTGKKEIALRYKRFIQQIVASGSFARDASLKNILQQIDKYR